MNIILRVKSDSARDLAVNFDAIGVTRFVVRYATEICFRIAQSVGMRQLVAEAEPDVAVVSCLGQGRSIFELPGPKEALRKLDPHSGTISQA